MVSYLILEWVHSDEVDKLISFKIFCLFWHLFWIFWTLTTCLDVTKHKKCIDKIMYHQCCVCWKLVKWQSPVSEVLLWRHNHNYVITCRITTNYRVVVRLFHKACRWYHCLFFFFDPVLFSYIKLINLYWTILLPPHHLSACAASSLTLDFD